MSSKMREALEAAYKAGRSDMLGEIASAGNDLADQAERVNEIASRYGDLEFTREEVRGMLGEAVETALNNCGQVGPPGKMWNIPLLVKQILSRNLGESESGDRCPNPRCQSFGCAQCDDIDREVGDLTKRVAAIEKALLARGHKKGCMCWRDGCTCGYDELQKPDPDSRV